MALRCDGCGLVNGDSVQTCRRCGASLAAHDAPPLRPAGASYLPSVDAKGEHIADRKIPSTW